MEPLTKSELEIWDQYAAAALQVVAARIVSQTTDEARGMGRPMVGAYEPAAAAKLAGRIADALLEERNARKTPPPEIPPLKL